MCYDTMLGLNFESNRKGGIIMSLVSNVNSNSQNKFILDTSQNLEVGIPILS